MEIQDTGSPLWRAGLRAVDPRELFRNPALGGSPRGGKRAFLFWGKAASRSWQAAFGEGWLEAASPFLVVSPDAPPKAARGVRGRWFLGEHPLPGPGSFEAGGAILDFFDSLRRSGVTELWVFLSGGASSLAWVPTVPRRELRERLEHLYALPLSIQQLNAERSRLCALKHGGAARWLRRLSPGTRARVLLISDVHPFGPGVVGSGPFWERGVPHRVLADNRTCVAAIASEARRRQQPVLWTGSGRVDSWQQWVKTLESQVRRFVAEGRSGVLILGGEPAVALEHSGKPRRGGRMSHLAAALGLALFDVFEKHELEVLCMSSDGVDGTSGASGALLGAEFRRRALSSRGAASRAKLAWAVENHETARVLRDWKLLFPAAPTGTNVQDCVVISLASPLL